MNALSVFVLDDDVFMLESLQCMLESIGGCNVVTSESADMILAALDMQNPWQVLLCDLNMPEMDGIEVIRHLGRHGYKGAIAVLSGEDARTLKMAVNIGRSFHLRLLGALAKPLERTAILHMLNEMHNGVSTSFLPQTSLSQSEILVGLSGDALTPYFQPQIDANNNRLVGVEALARWHHPHCGMLGPGSFIPMAEENGMIAQMTQQMMIRSMYQWRKWQEAGLELMLSINISMRGLDHLDFPDWIVSQAQEIGMPLENLILEITENQLPTDTCVSFDVLARLCLKRIRLSIDDFGTAYSNLERLQMLPFHEIKIDKAFVHGAAKNKLAHSILKSGVELGRELGMRVVAEGVETQEDWDCAVKAGANLIQGYFVARPMSGNQIVDWAAQWECRQHQCAACG